LRGTTVVLSVVFAWGLMQAGMKAFDIVFGAGHASMEARLWDVMKLDSGMVTNGSYWSVITAPLIHANALHFLLNFAAILLAGPDVERIIGRRHFIGLMLSAWVLGSAASWGAHLSTPDQYAEVAGFSAPSAAVLAAYCTIMPELEHRVNLFFVLPMRFRAKFMALSMVLLAASCAISETVTVIGPAGILAGTVLGWAWMKQLGFGNPLWIQRIIFDRRQRAERLQRMGAEDFVTAEVDPILEKIARSGIDSLTRAERKLLEQGSRKLNTECGED
jgi:membrane associated rhomboid family serine protease